jgi:hypothetical protein
MKYRDPLDQHAVCDASENELLFRLKILDNTNAEFYSLMEKNE